ncbi:MAG TPA: serine/threonine-protein kinase [Ktedonobacteraceae bacterium]|nr:serine/threonine-protein kinase [Ktedonobacteraceae bacterium]
MLDFQEPISERYHLQQLLHHGFMSDVYLAHDQRLQCDVAIKLVCNDQTESKLRLQSEIQTLSALSHDHILPILDYGEYSKYHYLVMPYLKQGTLLHRIKKEILTGEETAWILTQVTGALQYAHDNGIIHRDIKPSNLLFDNDKDHYVYLADFGLAKAIAKGSDITQTGCIIGTPEYMAPELIDKPESVSSDIYALGILLYHMLTGRPPFRGTTPLAIFWKHVHEPPIPPSHLNPAVSPPVEHVILRALHKDPRQRFPDANAMAQAYSKALQSSQQTKVPLRIPIFEPQPAHVPIKKMDGSVSPVAAPRSVSIVRSRNHRYTFQRTIISLAFVAMFIIPLSLGFILGRERVHVSPALSAQFASDLHKSASLVSTPRLTPTDYPSRAKTIPQHTTPSVLHHKHKHHKHGNDNENEIET